MRFLLDTHAFVWATVEPERLSGRARDLIGDPANECLLSAVSAYEIEYKRERDATLKRVPANLERGLRGAGFTWLAITPAHAAAAGRLPRHHGDPFDRLLVAQALAERVPLLSLDRRLPAYGVEVIW